METTSSPADNPTVITAQANTCTLCVLCCVYCRYDGSNRVNDFYEFDIASRRWSLVQSTGTPPSPRDRHTGVVHSTNFYVFAGFDGAQRVNDFFCFSFVTNKWSPVQVLSGVAPSPRHSHASVVFGNSMFVFAGTYQSCSRWPLTCMIAKHI
jgi:N-acetylneuraminic acid mutarotase